ncbi:MAG: ABC transporter ATP-binding protein [Bacilli bacterium]
MKGLKYIFTYLSKQKIILIFSILFIFISVYFQVKTPKIMGNSITNVTNVALVESVYKQKEDILKDINKKYVEQNIPKISMNDFENMIKLKSEEELSKLLSNQEQNMSSKEFKEKTGFTIKELLLLDKEKVNNVFSDNIKNFIVAVAILVISIYIYTLSMAYIASKSSYLMKIDLFKKLHDLSIRFFDSRNDGDILSIFTNDMDNISTFITQSLVQVMSSLILLGYITYTMFKENVELATIIICMALVLILIITIIIRKANAFVSKRQVKLGALNGYIDEQLAGQKANISNGVEEKVYENFLPFADDLAENSLKGEVYSGLLIPINLGFMLIATALVILIGSRLVVNGAFEIGLLVTFITFTQRFFQPFNQISSQYSILQLGVSGAKRVSEVKEEQSELYISKNPIKIDSIEGKVEFKNVNFGYNDDKMVLKDLTFDVKKGQTFAIVGPTGSGKTTIMNLLNRFYDVNSGEILFDGININEIEIETLRKNIGIVLQDSVIFSGTIRDNIAYGVDNVSDQEIIQTAKLAKLHDYIETLDEKYDTVINNSTSLFSTGQKQLLSIARTILINPSLLILDEATSNVDTVTEAKIQKAMDNVIHGRTSFVIAHRLKTILNADIILVLKDGQILQQGSHEQLLQEEGLYKELYTTQFVFE